MSPMSPSDWTPDLTAGNRMSVCSNSSEDTIHSPLSRQLSGCKPAQPGSIWSWSTIMRLIDFFPDVQVLTGRVWTVASARETAWDWRTAPTQGPSAAEPSSTLTSPPAPMTSNPSNYRSAFYKVLFLDWLIQNWKYCRHYLFYLCILLINVYKCIQTNIDYFHCYLYFLCICYDYMVFLKSFLCKELRITIMYENSISLIHYYSFYKYSFVFIFTLKF